VENSIRTHYHKGWRAEDKYLASAYQKDFEDHLLRQNTYPPPFAPLRHKSQMPS
jgi:hypothetical protein